MSKSPLKRNLVLAASAAAMLTLAACSGGGGGSTSTPTSPPVGSPPSPPPPPPPAGNTWTQGQFDPASNFQNECENPRSGVDIEGNGFPDVQGTLSDELFWLRSWTDETYLWNDQVTDRDPDTFDDRLDYFAVLKTTATTVSGEDLDDFHFSQSTEEFLEQRNSTASSGYGLSLSVASNTPPRDYRVRYTEPNSPASALVGGQPNFERGDRILEIDGVDLVNGSSDADIAALNAGLFPAVAGETHTFRLQAPDGSVRNVSVTSADVSRAPVNQVSVINTPTGDVGYIVFNTFSPFSSEEAIYNAFVTLNNQGVNDLVLDLRYNGGGLLAVAAQLGYMIAGDAQTAGRTFELLQFNDPTSNINPVTGEFNSPIPFYDTGLGFSLSNGTPLPSLNLNRVFILSTAGTCSASEAVLNGLRGIDVEIILIGDITCGKPYGFYPQDNCGETYYTIQFRGVNDKGFGDFSDGFVPQNSSFTFGERVAGCLVADDLTRALGDPDEGLLSAALTYRENGTCPAPPASTVTLAADLDQAEAAAASVFGAMATTTLTPAERVLENNRDMRMPNE